MLPNPYQELSMLTNEQVLAAHKSNVETLLGLTASSIDAVEKLVALNLETARAALGEIEAGSKTVLTAKDPQSAFALPSDVLQPAAEKTAAYGRKVYDIAAALQAEFGKVVEATTSDAQKKFTALVDNAVKNAPAGSENAVTLMKAAVAAANDAYESAQKVARQAAGAAEANFSTLTAVATKPASKTKRAA
jgi:phasin family protein